MTVTGIVCEYNPFHSGHAWQLERIRELFPDSAAVCVMSGSFVQRGEPAVASKWARARMAALNGADLVLELPAPWSVASAERFALAGVEILEKCGCVDHLAFGCECPDAHRLSRLAAALDTDEARERIRARLASGRSYPAARELALNDLLGPDSALLREPNNILAVEYLKALRRLGSGMEPLPLPRRGPAHDGGTGSGFASASHIRGLLLSGGDPSPFLPASAWEILRAEIAQGRAPVSADALDQAAMYRLRTMAPEDFSALPDSGEGLDRRLSRAARASATLAQTVDLAKTKRYTHSRLRRMCLSALLGVTADIQADPPPYIRVLAIGPRGREVLRTMKRTAALPIVTKPAAPLPPDAARVLALEARAGDIYALAFPEPSQRVSGLDWTTTPAVVEG